MRLEVAVPERPVLNERAVSVQLPLATGYLGVLPDHAPLLAKMGTGVLTFSGPDGAENCVALDGGVAEVLGDCVRVLAERAERSGEIDVDRARSALARAEQHLESPSLETDVDRAQRAAGRARARIAAAAAQ
ncbi:MAG: ATP synthase F1 subunit epsilon [Bryobacterales bacterium]|nr:ATP synthase F1 subunit epsilon [Bryobacterales bacterium]